MEPVRVPGVAWVLRFAQDGGVGKMGCPWVSVEMVGFGESEPNDYDENGCG